MAHSYVAFYMDKWEGGTAKMTRLVRSVYFDICLHNWDKVKPASIADQMLMFDDLGEQAQGILRVLVATGKLKEDPEGGLYCEKAIEEGQKALDLWNKKSGGGKKGAVTTNGAKSEAATPAPTPAVDKIRLEETPSEKESGGKPPSSSGDDKKADPPAPKPVARKSYDIPAIVDAWNLMARKIGLTQIAKMTEERQKKMRARLDDYGPEDVLKAISAIPNRPFLIGQNERKWKANIDFFLRPDSIAKINEGNYADGNGGWADA